MVFRTALGAPNPPAPRLPQRGAVSAIKIRVGFAQLSVVQIPDMAEPNHGEECRGEPEEDDAAQSRPTALIR